MNQKEIVIIKLGGSVITNKKIPYTANVEVIKRLTKEIKKAQVAIIIVHGQGSYAHTSAKKYGGKRGYSSLYGIAQVFNDAMEMNRVIMKNLISERIPAVSFRPNSLFVASFGKMQEQNLEGITLALKQGLIPVIYGDVILDRKWKTTIFSGETSTAYIAQYLLSRKIKISKIIQVGTTDGVYDKSGVTIPVITEKNFPTYKRTIFESESTDVTGGMKHKVENALMIAKIGIPTYIINGLVKNNLFAELRNKQTKHTLIQ